MDNFKSFLLSMFGSYEPVSYTVSNTVQVGEEVYTDVYDVIANGLAGVDWPWVMGALCFVICLYSFFRIVGMVLGRR